METYFQDEPDVTVLCKSKNDMPPLYKEAPKNENRGFSDKQVTQRNQIS